MAMLVGLQSAPRCSCAMMWPATLSNSSRCWWQARAYAHTSIAVDCGIGTTSIMSRLGSIAAIVMRQRTTPTTT